VRLTEIFRQAAGSSIVSYAHAINRGEHPNLAQNSGDFFFLRRADAQKAADTVVELCRTRLPNNMKIPPSDIQVLTPTRKYDTGMAALNVRLQAALNPPSPEKKERRFGETVFREGDRVMQIRNDYDIVLKNPDGTTAGTGVYNGDVGQITAIDPQTETLAVCYDGKTATYGFEMLNELEHAWVMTVHKSQGSEYRAVVLCIGRAGPMLLTRSVLYTAITRQDPKSHWPEGGWLPSERIDAATALRNYTLGSAYAAGDEQNLGSLEPGKYADLVVLDQNPLTIDPQELQATKVQATYLAGNLIYER